MLKHCSLLPKKKNEVLIHICSKYTRLLSKCAAREGWSKAFLPESFLLLLVQSAFLRIGIPDISSNMHANSLPNHDRLGPLVQN